MKALMAVATVVAVLFTGCGPSLVEVPELRGLVEKDAKVKLEAHGLKLGEISKEHDKKVLEGRVISQTPKVGTKVQEECAVALTISLGEERSSGVGRNVQAGANRDSADGERSRGPSLLGLLAVFAVVCFVFVFNVRSNAFRGTYRPRLKEDFLLWALLTFICTAMTKCMFS